jgi:hypothetical protein
LHQQTLAVQYYPHQRLGRLLDLRRLFEVLMLE